MKWSPAYEIPLRAGCGLSPEACAPAAAAIELVLAGAGWLPQRSITSAMRWLSLCIAFYQLCSESFSLATWSRFAWMRWA